MKFWNIFSLPFPAYKYDSRSEEEEEGDAEEVDQVAGVDHAFADGGVVVVDAERFDEIANIAQCIKRIDKLEAKRKDKADGRGQDKRHDLVGGEARNENAYGNERCTQKEKPQVGTPSASHINIANRVSQIINCDDIDKSRN